MQIDKNDFVKATADESAAFKMRLAEIKKKEAPSTRIMVVYPNGDYIHEHFNKDTMLEVVRRAGVIEVRNLNIPGHVGKGTTPYVPFVSDKEYRDKSGSTQTWLDRFWILTKIGKGEMVSILTQISNRLGLNLHIEIY